VMVPRHSPRSLSRNCQVGDPCPRTAFRPAMRSASPMAFRGASWAHALANAMDLSVSLFGIPRKAR
jgi:hypothetical protein